MLAIRIDVLAEQRIAKTDITARLWVETITIGKVTAGEPLPRPPRPVKPRILVTRP